MLTKGQERALDAIDHASRYVRNAPRGFHVAVRWHWRTWNLLLQIREATDGEDARQRSGEMTERHLCVAHTPELRALAARGWVVCVGNGEIFDDNGNSRVLPTWEVTPDGRDALTAAVKCGLTIQ